jgi:hypothetical protein
MNDACVICGKDLGVGVSRFPHLMGHLQDGTAHAKVDFKNDYWWFHPTTEGLKKYKGLQINVADGSTQENQVYEQNP